MGVYFGTDFEQESIDRGIARQQHETGVVVQWWFWDPRHSAMDPIYDEPVPGASLSWQGPFSMPVLQATRTEGTIQTEGDGSYVVDSISLVLGYGQARDAGLLPLVDQSHEHLKDRFVWDGKVWSPSSIVARNKLGGRGTRAVILVSATEVRDDELVNDPQFQQYAEPTYVAPGGGEIPLSDYGEVDESTEPYHE